LADLALALAEERLEFIF